MLLADGLLEPCFTEPQRLHCMWFRLGVKNLMQLGNDSAPAQTQSMTIILKVFEFGSTKISRLLAAPAPAPAYRKL
jgi:hypothetical protein